MGKGYKTGFAVIFVLIILILGTYFCSKCVFNRKKTHSFSVVVDSIKNYGYTLDKRDSKLFKTTFKELKKLLGEKEIDNTKYAELIAELYIIDLYDIENKVNKYDVPCLEYIYKSEQDKFKKMIKSGFYSKLEDNSDNDRKQELPSVESINIIETTPDKFSIGDKEFDSYNVAVEWTYKKDLGFDKKALITLVIDEGKAYVVKASPIMD